MTYHHRFRWDILYDASRGSWKPMPSRARTGAFPQDSAGLDSVHVKAVAERLRTNPDDLDALVAVGA